MTRSLGEIESLAKRAARGAGFPWALAEEAGKAARWLHAFGLPGCETLVDYLAGQRGGAPTSLQGRWRCDGPLCPIAAGASLVDCAHMVAKTPIHLETAASPLLLLPFAARAALVAKTTVTLGWATTDGCCLRLDQLPDEQSCDVLCSAVAPLTGGQSPAQRGQVSEVAWNRLLDFAARTYAPATEASRKLGAGAGVTDSD